MKPIIEESNTIKRWDSGSVHIHTRTERRGSEKTFTSSCTVFDSAGKPIARFDRDSNSTVMRIVAL